MASRQHTTRMSVVRTAFGKFKFTQIMRTHKTATVAGSDTNAGHISHLADGPVHQTTFLATLTIDATQDATMLERDVSIELYHREKEAVLAHAHQQQPFSGTVAQPTISATATQSMTRKSWNRSRNWWRPGVLAKLDSETEPYAV